MKAAEGVYVWQQVKSHVTKTYNCVTGYLGPSPVGEREQDGGRRKEGRRGGRTVSKKPLFHSQATQIPAPQIPGVHY